MIHGWTMTISDALNSVGSHHQPTGLIPVGFADDGFGNGVFDVVCGVNVHKSYREVAYFFESDQ